MQPLLFPVSGRYLTLLLTSGTSFQRQISAEAPLVMGFLKVFDNKRTYGLGYLKRFKDLVVFMQEVTKN